MQVEPQSGADQRRTRRHLRSRVEPRPFDSAAEHRSSAPPMSRRHQQNASSLFGAGDRSFSAARGSALFDQARPTQKARRHARRFIKPEFVQVQDSKCPAQFVTNLLFCNHRRPGSVWLARVAGQNQAAAARSQLPRRGRGVLRRRGSANGNYKCSPLQLRWSNFHRRFSCRTCQVAEAPGHT